MSINYHGDKIPRVKSLMRKPSCLEKSKVQGEAKWIESLLHSYFQVLRNSKFERQSYKKHGVHNFKIIGRKDRSKKKISPMTI